LPDRKTFSQIVYPNLPDLNDPDHWSLKQSKRFFELVWQALDLLAENFPDIDFTRADNQIERDFTQFVERRIHDVMSTEEPFVAQHEVYEMETILPESNRPPQYDIAFIIREDEKLMFPIEAKVLKTDGQVSKYVKDINDAFLPCIYAPFSYEGAMLGFLLSGKAEKAFENIGNSLNIVLKQHPDFTNRPHKCSDHNRKVPMGKENSYPSKFRCHHLIWNLN
jgi:hypothetical protein